jgi:hypothetical protein
MPTPRGPQPKPAIDRHATTTDKKRKYNIGGSSDPFTVAELKEYIVEPLEACVNMSDFLELANWCASEDPRLLRALYLNCELSQFSGYIEYLQAAYGCGRE